MDAALTDRLDALAAGAGGIVVVEGPAAAGKTRLLDAFATAACERTVRTFRGDQAPFGPFVPFGPLLDALLGAEAPIADADELRALLAAPTSRSAKIAALSARIGDAASVAPLTIIIDDLQWSDDATLQALRALAPGLADRPILWVVALRVGYGTRDLAATLAALDGAGAQRIALTDVAATGGGAQAIAERVDHLPDAARELVQLAAVFGQSAAIAELKELLGWSHAELGDPLGRALASGLIAERDGRLEFREERERELVERSIPTAIRRGLLRQRVDLELARGATAASVAPTLAAVAQPGDDAAVTILRQALRELADSAPGVAADLGLRAIELAGPRTHRGAVLAAETVSLLRHAGRVVEARAVGDAALAGALSPDHEAAIRFALARMETEESVADAASQGLRGSALEGAPTATRDRLLAAFAAASVRTGTVGAEPVEAATAAAASADPVAQVTGLVALSMIRHHTDFAAAFALIERAGAVVAEHGAEAGALAIPDAWRTWMLQMAGRADEALTIADAAVARALQAGSDGAARQWAMLRGAQLLELGRLADGAASARTSLDLGAHGRRPGDVADANAWYVLGRVALDRGDPRTLREAVVRAEDALAGASPRVHRMGTWLRAIAADADGDHELAGSLIALALRATADDSDAFAPPPLTFPQSPADDVLLVRIALGAGARDAAGAAVAALERRAAGNPGRPSLHAAALHARGLLDGDAERLRAASAAWDATGRTLAIASALEDLGVALAPAEREAAVGRLEAARALYEQAGAEHHAGRVRRRLRDLGRRLRRVVPVDPVGATIGDLTAAETAVARLVAEGATNRQVAERLFLSPHTVSSHLRQVYAKLGIRSRGELPGRLEDLQKTLHA